MTTGDGGATPGTRKKKTLGIRLIAALRAKDGGATTDELAEWVGEPKEDVYKRLYFMAFEQSKVWVQGEGKKRRWKV
jgi:hypothetical protein